MDAQSARTSSSLLDSIWSSGGSGASDTFSMPIIIPSTQPVTNSSQQKQLQTDIKTIDTYLACEEAPKTVCDALERVCKAIKKRDLENLTADALKVL